jgi:hypothetical protein
MDKSPQKDVLGDIQRHRSEKRSSPFCHSRVCPKSHSHEAFAELRKIERGSKLPADTPLSTHWIKRIRRRMAGQKTTHIIANFTTTEAANQRIREGIIIAGKWARTKMPKAQCTTYGGRMQWTGKMRNMREGT